MNNIGQFAARELINNSWTVLGICIVLIFSRWLWTEFRQSGFSIRDRNKAAISITIYFVGEAVARGWTVAMLWSFRHPTYRETVQGLYPIALIGGAIAMWGALCMIRIFTPAEWRHWPWVVSGILAVSWGWLIALT